MHVYSSKSVKLDGLIGVDALSANLIGISDLGIPVPVAGSGLGFRVRLNRGQVYT